LPNSDRYGVATVILNDSASDPYWTRNSGGTKKSAPTLTATW